MVLRWFMINIFSVFFFFQDGNSSVIVLPQPSDFVELLSERLNVLDSDSIDFKSSSFTNISSLDTHLFSDSGEESDDSGVHSFSDVTLCNHGRNFSFDDDLLQDVMYCMDDSNVICGENYDDDVNNKSDNSDDDSGSSSGSSDDDSGSSSSSDEMDEDDDEHCEFLVCFHIYLSFLCLYQRLAFHFS